MRSQADYHLNVLRIRPNTRARRNAYKGRYPKLVVRKVHASGTVLDQMRPAATSTSHSADQTRRSAAHRVVRSVGKTRPATIGGMHPA
jgi:hypothetical protein